MNPYVAIAVVTNICITIILGTIIFAGKNVKSLSIGQINYIKECGKKGLYYIHVTETGVECSTSGVMLSDEFSERHQLSGVSVPVDTPISEFCAQIGGKPTLNEDATRLICDF